MIIETQNWGVARVRGVNEMEKEDAEQENWHVVLKIRTFSDPGSKTSICLQLFSRRIFCYLKVDELPSSQNP